MIIENKGGGETIVPYGSCELQRGGVERVTFNIF